MAAELRILITAQNQAKGVLGDLRGDLENTHGIAGKLGDGLKVGLAAGAVAATAAIAGLGAVLMSSTKAASEAEDIQAQLNAVLKSTEGVAGMTADAINKMALDLSKVTKFEDDTIVKSSALLLTFTKIGKDVFPDAQKAILNVSQAMGTDLQSATIMVGKALNDPAKGMTALSKAGIQFTEEQKNTIKSLIEGSSGLDGLASSANKASGALPGLQDKLAVAALKLQEMTAGGKASGSQLLAQQQKVADLEAKIKDATFTMSAYDAAQKNVTTGASKQERVMSAQKIILKELETQFGGSAVAAGKTLSGQLEILKNQFGNVKEEIGGALIPMLTELAKAWGPKLVSVAEKFAAWITTRLVPGIKKASDFIGKLKEAFDRVKRMIADLNAGKPVDIFKLLGLAGLFTNDLNIQRAFATIAQNIMNGIKTVIDAFKDGGLIGALKAAAGVLWSGIHQWWDEHGAEWVSTTLSKIGAWLGTIPGKLASIVTGAAQWLAGVWTSLHEWWDTSGEQWASDTAGKIRDWAIKAVADVKLGVQNLWLNLKAAWEAIDWAKIKSDLEASAQSALATIKVTIDNLIVTVKSVDWTELQRQIQAAGAVVRAQFELWFADPAERTRLAGIIGNGIREIVKLAAGIAFKTATVTKDQAGPFVDQFNTALLQGMYAGKTREFIAQVLTEATDGAIMDAINNLKKTGPKTAIVDLAVGINVKAMELDLKPIDWTPIFDKLRSQIRDAIRASGDTIIDLVSVVFNIKQPEVTIEGQPPAEGIVSVVAKALSQLASIPFKLILLPLKISWEVFEFLNLDALSKQVFDTIVYTLKTAVAETFKVILRIQFEIGELLGLSELGDKVKKRIADFFAISKITVGVLVDVIPSIGDLPGITGFLDTVKRKISELFNIPQSVSGKGAGLQSLAQVDTGPLEKLKTVLGDIKDLVAGAFTAVITTLSSVNLPALGTAASTLAAGWIATVHTALTNTWAFVTTNLQPALVLLTATILPTLATAAQSVATAWASAFIGMGAQVQAVTDKVLALIFALSKVPTMPTFAAPAGAQATQVVALGIDVQAEKVDWAKVRAQVLATLPATWSATVGLAVSVIPRVAMVDWTTIRMSALGAIPQAWSVTVPVAVDTMIRWTALQWDAIKAQVLGAIPASWRATIDVLIDLAPKWGPLPTAPMDALTTAIAGASTAIKDALSPVLGALANVVLPAVDSAAAATTSAWSMLDQTWRETWAFLISSLQPTLNTLTFTNLPNLQATVSALAQTWNDTLQAALVNTWAFVTGSLVPAIQSIADTIGGALIGALGAVLGPIGAVVSALTGITNEANTARDAVLALIDAINSIPSMPSLATGEQRAKGGPVRAGMPYMVGERGPEMFVPATSGRILANGGAGSGRVVNIYVTGNSFGKREDVDYMLAQLDRKLRLQGGILPI